MHRLYLINSPVVRGENLRFKEEGVSDILKDVQLPWYNAYRFLVQNIVRYRIETGNDFVPVNMNTMTMVDMMDKWIVSAVNSLVHNVRIEMAAYRLYTVVPLLLRFIDTLTNWCVGCAERALITFARFSGMCV
jgi:isoleucyl-tRNA synthetase